MRIREAELRDAAAMARVMVDSYRAAHRDQIPEESLMKLTGRGSLNATGHARYASSAKQPSARSTSMSRSMMRASSSVWRWEDQSARTILSILGRSMSSICSQRTSVGASGAN
jgi:hypothetical protein